MGWSRRVLPAHAHSAAWDISPPGPSCPEPGASLTQCILARPSHFQQGGGLVVAVGGRERNRIGRTDRMPLTTANYSAATFNRAPFLQPHPRTPLEPPSIPRMSLRRLPAHRSYSPASSEPLLAFPAEPHLLLHFFPLSSIYLQSFLIPCCRLQS